MPYGVNPISGEVVGKPAGCKCDCLACLAGHFCLNGTVTPEPCGKGKYTNPGQSVCQTCLPGRYCDEEATTEERMNSSKQCSAGLYCVEGLTAESDARNCSEAHYCPQGLFFIMNMKIIVQDTVVKTFFNLCFDRNKKEIYCLTCFFQK